MARFTLPVWAVVLDGVRHVFIPRAWESTEFRRKHRLHNCFGNLQEERSGLNSKLWGQRSEGDTGAESGGGGEKARG